MCSPALTKNVCAIWRVKLYEQGLLSSDRAARFLGISRWEFLDLLGRYGVSYFDDSSDVAAEVRRAQP